MKNLMGKYGPRTAKFTAGARISDPYDRWPLALEYGNAASAVAGRMPPTAIVGRPPAPEPVPQMFKGLDQYASSRDRASGVVSLVVHVLLAAGILLVGMLVPTKAVQTAVAKVSPIHISLYDPPPPPVMQVAKAQGGGGGGGARQVEPPVKGHPPVEVKRPMVQLEAAKINLPKLSVEPTSQVRLPQDTPIANLGAPQSTQVALASQGSGSNAGFGIGAGGGIGQGNGTGIGPGANGGYGGGLMNVGGGVSAPRVIHSVEPQFTPEARQANYQGVVGIQLIVDSQGNPQAVHVVRHLGMGLDERAIEAVRQYKFSPAMYQGHAVAVQLIIDVDFRLH